MHLPPFMGQTSKLNQTGDKSLSRTTLMHQVAATFCDARQTGTPIQALEEDNIAQSVEEASVVQDAMAAQFGDIGGWKIGAASATSTPVFSPMPLRWIVQTDAILSGPHYRLRGVEAEIAFQIGTPLPPRERPYTREEVADAIAICAPAIELLESAFQAPLEVESMAKASDLQMHGGFAAGSPIPAWKQIDWNTVSVKLWANDELAVEATGSNPGGTDLLRFLTYLANEGSKRTGGLRAGQWVTTGSWTGASWYEPQSSVTVEFNHAQPLRLHFA